MFKANLTIGRVCLVALTSVFATAGFKPNEAKAQIAIGVSVDVAPPVLPIFVQPPLPSPGYVWTPGYWAWNAEIADYYWIPGAWVAPPRVGVLWTPGYWGWSDGAYLFHGGYWGPTVGFYGGVNYGFGYTGNGFFGGEWREGQYYYNSSVNNVKNVNVTNVYEKTVVIDNDGPRTSFNGGPHGVAAKPTASQLAAANQTHVQMTAAQVQHIQAAKASPALRFSTNKGQPTSAATQRAIGKAPPTSAAAAHNRPEAAAAAPAEQREQPVEERRPASDQHAAEPQQREQSHAAQDAARNQRIAARDQRIATRIAARDQRIKARQEARQQRIQEREAKKQQLH